METVTQALSNRIVELEGAGFELPVGVMSNLKESLKDQSGATSAQTILSLKDADHLRELKTVEGQKNSNIEHDSNVYYVFPSTGLLYAMASMRRSPPRKNQSPSV